MQIEYAQMLKWFQHNHPDQIDRLIESLSPNQIKCKKWLVSELEAFVIEEPWREFSRSFPLNIEHIGGWFGWPLVDFMKHLPIESYRNVEADPFAVKVFNRYVDFFDPDFDCRAIESDIRDLNPTNSKHGSIRVVINTSCEHMPPLPELLKDRGYIEEKVVFFLQSNNLFDEPDHINCVSSCEELIQQSGLTKVYSAGTLDMGHYERYMVVGKWK